MNNKDNNICALTHLLAIIPIWGIAANALILYYYRARNRLVVFHAKQAIAIQAVCCVLFLLAMAAKYFCALVAVVLPSIGGFFTGLNYLIILIAAFIYFILCCFAAWATLVNNGDFQYPVIGKKISR